MTGNKDNSRGGMIPEGFWGSRRSWAAPLGLMLLLLLTELGGEPLRQLLRYDRSQINAGQWYRLLSGNFVHLGWMHWALNELSLVLLVMLCPQNLTPAVWLRRLLILGLGVSLGLYFAVPRLQHYVGLSGVVYGLFVLGLVPQVLRRDWIAAAALLYILAKLLFEWTSGASLTDARLIGGAVVGESHLFGIVTAFGYGLLFGAFRRGENPGST